METVFAPSVVNPIQLDEMEVKIYKKQGYLVIPGLIDSQQIDDIRSEILNNVRLTCGDKPSKLAQTGQYLANSFLDQMINSIDTLRITEQLLGGPSTLYMPFSAVKSSKVGGQFHFHQDNQYTYLDGPALNMWIAMDDMTPENGCLCVCPGSHQEGTLQSTESPDKDGHKTITYNVEEYLPLRMRAGDAVVFNRLTVHGSGKNITSRDRVAYALQYHRNDVKARRIGETEFFLLTERPRVNTRPVEVIKPKDEPKND